MDTYNFFPGQSTSSTSSSAVAAVPTRARGPWYTDGEHSALGCLKDQRWFCETCCCKHGNPNWRDYLLPQGAQTVDSGGSEISSQPNALTPNSGPGELAAAPTEYAPTSSSNRYLVTTIASYPEDCTVCVQRDDHGGPWTCGVEECSAASRANGGATASEMLASVLGTPTEAQAQAQLPLAEQSPSLLQLAQSPVSDDPSHPLTDPNLGTVPMCCDVGMLRDEDGTPFRCDFDG